MERTRALVTGAFKTWWDALAPQPAITVVYDNLKGKPAAGVAWGRVTVLQGRNWSPFVGSRRKRSIVFLTLQIFIPEDSGVKLASEIAQRMSDQFDDSTLTATDGAGVQTVVLFRAASLVLVGAKDGYQQFNVFVEAQRDTIYPG